MIDQLPPVLPHSIDAEQQLLGAVLLSADALDCVEDLVTADDFYEPLHRFLFAQFIRGKTEGRRITLGLAQALLAEEVRDADIGGLTVSQYLARLAAEATTIINAPDFARLIAEYADRRRLADVASSLTAATKSSDSGPAMLATDCIEQLDAIAARYSAGHVAPVSAAVASERSVERMQSAMANTGKVTGVTTGVRLLDEQLNGWQRGNFIILAGRPGMGKSGLIISSARQSAERGTNVLLFSLEMTAEDVTDRMLADAVYRSRAPIPYCDIGRGRLTDVQADRVRVAQKDFRRLSIKIDPQGGLSAAQIAARARKHKHLLERQGRTLDLVIVDHLHIMRASNRYAGNRVAEVTEISSALKALAKELNAPVFALAQLSRQVENRDDKRPTMADLRDSGSLEQDADAILFVYREGYYLQQTAGDDASERLAQVRRKVEVHIAKQRGGPTGRIDLFFDVASNALRSEPPYDLTERGHG
ncbi:DnaB-like helicase C-terminal domain-containing protein [Bradyrhizobium sp. SRS-191]|uniref:replicative DNA helicase n=1 Tax=Bradyrhizobium sp. SRS-191 TaxID=2962606 RepID=UPI00211E54B1|nr:DnaB-like helicase C-terminal domain-containing protein [Bradyrhizobium sp. SRS-191]